MTGRANFAIDRGLTIVVAIVSALLIRYGWRHYPVPREGGVAILGIAAALAVAALFPKRAAGRPLLGRAIAAAATILATQAILQTVAAAGRL